MNSQAKTKFAGLSLGMLRAMRYHADEDYRRSLDRAFGDWHTGDEMSEDTDACVRRGLLLPRFTGDGFALGIEGSKRLAEAKAEAKEHARELSSELDRLRSLAREVLHRARRAVDTLDPFDADLEALNCSLGSFRLARQRAAEIRLELRDLTSILGDPW